MSSRQVPALNRCVALIAALALASCATSPVTPSPPAAVGPDLAASSPVAIAPLTVTPSPSAGSSLDTSPSLPILPDSIADLTGETTDPALAHRLPLAVLLDDNRVARPQSGFNSASLVYQAPADGGETRYMLVYGEGDSAEIGPVRSGRIYFVHWASEIEAAIGHYGGDRLTRAYLEAHDHERFTDIDALAKGAKAFHRVKGRTAPHNGYTSTTALRAMAVKLGGPPSMSAELYRRTFVAPGDPSALAVTQHIRIPYRTGLVEYRFDRATDLYQRILDGRPQVDAADDRPVTTRNVVVLFMSFRTDTRIEPGHSRPVVGAIGTGRALVFREGRLVEGTWSKAGETAPTRLLDATGAEIPLVIGRTFFQIVPDGTAVRAGA